MNRTTVAVPVTAGVPSRTTAGGVPAARSSSTSAPAAVAARSPLPARSRRAAVAGTGLLACLLPLVWGCATAVELATGVQADHRFHQVTGQGLLLSVLWLAGLVPLVRAGLRGRRPSTVSGMHHLAFLAATLTVAVLSPGDGIAGVAVGTAVLTALLWTALPLRPDLRAAGVGLDLLLVPLALLTTALLTPFVLGQVDLQHTLVDEHAELAHYVDMAWVSLAVIALGACAAVSSAARSLAVWSSGGLLVIGAARLAFTPDRTWSGLAVGLGATGVLLGLARLRATTRGTDGTSA
jgi:hypothetical protein